MRSELGRWIRNHVRLDNWEWVTRYSFYRLPPEDRVTLRKVGVIEFNKILEKRSV